MIIHGIDGRVFRVVKYMYSEAKYSVMAADQCSDFFLSCAGICQGENMSPLLFTLFLNDLKSTLEMQYGWFNNFSMGGG